jgi:hypothetical protein
MSEGRRDRESSAKICAFHPARSAWRDTYHLTAETSPRSSNRDGRKSKDRSRTCCMIWSRILRLSDRDGARWAASFPRCSVCRFIFTAVSACPISS